MWRVTAPLGEVIDGMDDLHVEILRRVGVRYPTAIGSISTWRFPGWMELPIFALYATRIQRLTDVFVSSQKRRTRILDGSPGGDATCANHVGDYSKLGERRFWYFFVSVKTRVISLSTYIVVV